LHLIAEFRYKEIVRRENAGSLDLAKATLVNPDEFLQLPEDHPETYNTYSRKHLFNHLKTAPAQWIIPASNPTDASAECARVEKAVADCGGIDWQLLGVGINGHVCFIEPADSIPAQFYVTPIAEVNRQLYSTDFGTLDAVPTHAITYGLRTLMSSSEMCLMAVGQGKADIVQRILFGNITTALPASFVQLHPNCKIVLDYAAASKLPTSLSPSNTVQIIRHD
jgi:glucosamine-6-phosphate deaminase